MTVRFSSRHSSPARVQSQYFRIDDLLRMRFDRERAGVPRSGPDGQFLMEVM